MAEIEGPAQNVIDAHQRLLADHSNQFGRVSTSYAAMVATAHGGGGFFQDLLAGQVVGAGDGNHRQDQCRQRRDEMSSV